MNFKTNLRAFRGKPAIKAKYLKRVAAHEAKDDIIRGTYGDSGGVSGWRGCAVGCTIHGSNHTAYESELGIPRAIAHLEDGLFEGMSADRAPLWPRRFLEAIPVGADLSNVVPKFLLWLLVDETWGVHQWANAQDKLAIDGVADLYRRYLLGEEISDTARDAAYAAYAADAVGRAARAAYAAARDAYAAAEAASDAARAAWSAARAARAAWSAARAAAYAASDATSDAAARAAYAAAEAAWSAAYAEWNNAAADYLIGLLHKSSKQCMECWWKHFDRIKKERS